MIIVVISYWDNDEEFQDYFGPFATDKVAEDWAEKYVSEHCATALVTTLKDPS